jgi:hypothetical protein
MGQGSRRFENMLGSVFQAAGTFSVSDPPKQKLRARAQEWRLGTLAAHQSSSQGKVREERTPSAEGLVLNAGRHEHLR